MDDLFDDVGNFTEVNTGKIVLFGISQITTMRLLVEIGLNILGPPRPPRITTTTTTTTSTTTTTTTPTTTSTTTFQAVVQPTDPPATNPPANPVTSSSTTPATVPTTVPSTTLDSTIAPAAVSGHDHIDLNIFLLLLVLFLRK